jgi:hypothetical protein
LFVLSEVYVVHLGLSESRALAKDMLDLGIANRRLLIATSEKGCYR